MYDTFMHVNLLERVFPLDQIVRRCADAGYDGIEFRGRDITGEMPLDEYLDYAWQTARANGLGVVFGCENQTTSPDIGVRTASLEDLMTVIRFAGEHQVKTLNLFTGPVLRDDVPYVNFEFQGSAHATEDQWRWTTEYLQKAGAQAEECGVKLCLETHHGYLHDLAESTLRLIEAVGLRSVQANFDYGNLYLNRKNQGLDKEYETLGEHVGYIHIKNVRSFNAFDSRLYMATPLGGGDINHLLLIRMIKDAGYSGVLTIENTMAGDKCACVNDDLTYLRMVEAECGMQAAMIQS